jgi:hypothetical protein
MTHVRKGRKARRDRQDRAQARLTAAQKTAGTLEVITKSRRRQYDGNSQGRTKKDHTAGNA